MSAIRIWKRPPFIKRAWLRWSLTIGGSLFLLVAIGTMDVNWQRVAAGVPRAERFISSFFLGAARNLAPRPIYLFFRGVLAVSRTFPEIIIALFAVKLFGFGPFAGIIALSIGSIGFYGKLLAEDIEDMDPVQAEAVKSTGSSWLQWLNYSVQPQVTPRMIGLAMYRFDINFRESAVLGIVGAGGIGATLLTTFDRYEFSSSASILLIIIGIVMAVEYSSGYIRKWVQ